MELTNEIVESVNNLSSDDVLETFIDDLINFLTNFKNTYYSSSSVNV